MASCSGCGTGNETVNLRRQTPGLRISGVDVSPAALAIAVTRPETRDAIFYRSTLENLPFPDAVFDYIASHEVIEHVEDPAVVLSELYRVLKPAGVCVIATPNGASLWIEQNFSPKRIQSWLGHSSIQMTYDTYGHLLSNQDDDAAAMKQVQARLLG